MIDVLGNLEQVFQYLSGQAVWWGLLVLGCSAMIEYVVPPFPGDTITIAGAVLIPQAGWPVAGVFGALLAGTAAGATADWYFGRWLASKGSEGTWIHRWFARESVAKRLDKLDDQFERWGSLYLVLNRFVPAFRALFFVAAGHTGLRLDKVLAFGCLGAAIYNAALLGVGYVAGYKLEAIAGWVDTYSRYFFIVVGILLALWLLRKLYRLYRS